MNDPRDTIVGDALRRLDVPDHAPDFWDRLDASLSGEPPDARLSDHEPDEHEADVIELGSAPSRRASAWSRVPNLAVAAAVVAAVALVVGVAVLRPAADDESQLDSATVPEGDPAPEPGAPITPEPDATAPAPSAQRSPEELASEWLSLLRDGEVEQAHALLDQASQQALPLQDFREVATGLAEGAGSFADLEPTAVPLIDDEGLAATAVVFAGDVEREGMIETASYAVVVTGDPEDPARELGVAFVLDGPTVTAEATSPGETRTSPLEVTLSPTAGASWAIVDGSAPERIDTAGDGAATIDVEAIAGPGTHTVTVISTEAGLYTSASFTVVVP